MGTFGWSPTFSGTSEPHVVGRQLRPHVPSLRAVSLHTNETCFLRCWQCLIWEL